MTRFIVQKKHIALSIILFFFSAFIFFVNYNWGNTVERSFNLSFMTFALIFLSFALVWELRDFYQLRWYRVDPIGVDIEPCKIPLSSNQKNFIETKPKNIKKPNTYWLGGEVLIANEKSKDFSQTDSAPLIVFVHGFSDNSIMARDITVPLAYNGYPVISYDHRGAGSSKSAGKKSDFLNITRDLGAVLNYAKTQKKFSNRDIVVLGFSLGSIAAVFHGLRNPQVRKIISVATISKYRTILPQSPIAFKGKWWLWLRYRLLGVPTNPPEAVEQILSPYDQIKELKRDMDSEDWKGYINNKLVLVHSKNDSIIPFSHFERNIKISEIKQENTLVTEKGGHNLVKYENCLLAEILFVLRKLREKKG